MRLLTGLGLVLLGLVLLAVVVAGLSYWSFNRRVEREIRELFARQPAPGAETVVTEEMLADLPAPVQRYLRYSGIVGKPRVHTVRLKQAGRFRLGPDRPWLDYTANQYYTVDNPGFLWEATFYMAGLPLLKVRDRYLDGEGRLLAKIVGLITVADGQGAGIDQGSMLRYLNEMMWFPSAFLGENITFTPIDDGSAQVTFADHGRSVTATIFIDEEGQIVDFAADRYYDAGDTNALWRTPIQEYGDYQGRRLPRRGVGVWKLPEGDYTYIDPAITEVEYDVAEAYP